MIDLREVNKEDFNFLFYLKKSTLKPYIEKVWGWDEETQLNLFKEKFSPDKLQIIRVDNQDIGLFQIEETKTDFFIHNIQVLPNHQNKGIGSFLIKSLIKRSIYLNKNVKIQVLKVNLKAFRLYERLGFKKYKETETHFQLKI